MSQVSSDRRAVYAAIALFAVSLIIRLIGINWTLPNDLHNTSLHPDEAVVYGNYVYMPNPMVPGNYNYPSLYPVMVRVAGDIVSTYGNIDSEQGLLPPPAPTPQDRMRAQEAMFTKYAPHQRAVNLAGRVLSALFGAGTAAVVFFLLLRLSGMIGALFGGALMGIAPAFVVHSRFQTVDVTSVFFMWLGILYAIKLYQCQDTKLLWRYAILAGVFAGLSTGTKYTGFVALFSLLAAVVMNKGLHIYDKKFRLIATGVVVCIVVFLITTPGVLLDTKQFLKGMRLETEHMRVGDDMTFLNTPQGFIYQVGNLFTGIGPLAFIIGAFGLVYGAIKKNPYIAIILPAFLVYFVIVGTSEVKFIRYGLPLIPGIAIGFGYAINGAIQRRKWQVAGYGLGVISLLGLESIALSGVHPSNYWACFDPRFGGLYGTIQYTKDMTSEDPRDQAARYVIDLTRKNPGSNVGLFRTPWFWTVPVIRDANFVFNTPTDMNRLVTALYLEVSKDPQVIMSYMTPPPKYVVLTSFETDPFDRITDRSQVTAEWLGRYDDLKKALDDIHANYNVIQTFGGEAPKVQDLEYVQPKVWVLQHK